MKIKNSFFWHDYETFGTHPGQDRASQFAGIRTDMDLNPIDAPIVRYCKPANDFLPHPIACLITGITPQKCIKEGIRENEFMQLIHQQLSQSGTCTAGYNSLRFDDEFTRFGFYRNFIDPYAREWQNGNSRWDLIDVVRMTAALRPDGINWPVNKEENRLSFKLEDLTVANDILHEDAHDALSDVYATIAIAALIKDKQPRLFDYLLGLRSKQKVLEVVNLQNPQPLVYTSRMYPGKYIHTAVALPLFQLPNNKNAIVMVDLRQDPQQLFDLSEEEISYRVFTKKEQLESEGLSRIGLKTLQINKCPAIATIKTMDEKSALRCQIDLSKHLQHAQKLKNIEPLREKLIKVLSPDYKQTNINSDPDAALYSGGFISDADKEKFSQIHSLKNPHDLMELELNFKDSRMDDLFIRYKARNYYTYLSKEQKDSWDQYRKWRMTAEDSPSGLILGDYIREINSLMTDASAEQKSILEDLLDYKDYLQLS